MIKVLSFIDMAFAAVVKWLLVAILLIMVLLGALQVFLRNLFNSGISWSDVAKKYGPLDRLPGGHPCDQKEAAYRDRCNQPLYSKCTAQYCCYIFGHIFMCRMLFFGKGLISVCPKRKRFGKFGIWFHPDVGCRIYNSDRFCNDIPRICDWCLS